MSHPPAPEPTRASRHARAAGAPRVGHVPSVRPRPVVTAATLVCGLVVAGAALQGASRAPAVALAAVGLLVALGVPLLGRVTAVGSTRVVLTLALAGIVAAVWFGPPPSLDRVAVAIAASVVLLCLHPLVSPTAREDLVAALARSALAVAVMACGAVLVTTVSATPRPLAVAGIAVAVAALPDLVMSRDSRVAWMLPVSVLVGGLAGLVAQVALGGAPEAWPVLVGMLVAAVALCLRRVLEHLPGVDMAAGAAGIGAASVLVTGPIVHLLGRLFLG